jgi:hypothetical protein
VFGALRAELSRGVTTFGLGADAVIAGIAVTIGAEVVGIEVTVDVAVVPSVDAIALVNTGGTDGIIGATLPRTVLVWLTESMSVLLSPPSVFVSVQETNTV